jgi:hypothetical protein
VIPFESSIVLRRRSAWEAADAGLLLWRRDFFYFLPFFAIPFWICAFALRLIPGKLQYWSWFVLWFLKPLFERPVLHVISVRLFESDAGFRRLCQGLGKALSRGLAGDLLWRRLSPVRVAMMPVRVLENCGFRGAGQRGRVLQRGGLFFCAFLSFWGFALEAALLGGEFLFCFFMSGIIWENPVFSSLGEFPAGVEIFFFAAYCFNYILVETLYVCMGFGVYLNSRVEVEGWDIEILFRSFAEARRHAPPGTGRCPRSRLSVVTALILFIVPEIFMPANNFAEEAPLETLQAILDSPDFGGERDGWEIRLKDKREYGKPEAADLPPLLKGIKQIFASALRLVLILLTAGLIVFSILYLRRFVKRKKSLPGGTGTKALNLRKEESVEHLLERARFFFAKEDLRRAWAFCFAAALRSLSLYRGMAFPPGATEYDCLELVDSAARPGEAKAFSSLVERWVGLVYAGRMPPRESFGQALAFCESLGVPHE